MIDWTTVESLGVVGILAFILVLFVRGQLWPKTMVDKTIDAQQVAAEKSATIIATQVKEGMKNAVREGISIGLSEGIKIARINDDKDGA